MKRYMIVLAAIAIFVAMVGGAYAGQIQPTVDVKGTVNGTCKAGTAGALMFTIDPSSTGSIAASVTTNATVFCTKNMLFTVTALSANKGGTAASCASPGGITGTLVDGSNRMDYTFTCGTAGGTGQGFAAGNDQSLNIDGSIAQAAYQSAAASTLYADTVTLTIAY